MALLNAVTPTRHKMAPFNIKNMCIDLFCSLVSWNKFFFQPQNIDTLI